MILSFYYLQLWRVHSLSSLQRQVLRSVPVTEVKYDFKQKEGRFWVYGFEYEVYCPDYPHNCCWGCTILWVFCDHKMEADTHQGYLHLKQVQRKPLVKFPISFHHTEYLRLCISWNFIPFCIKYTTQLFCILSYYCNRYLFGTISACDKMHTRLKHQHSLFFPQNFYEIFLHGNSFNLQESAKPPPVPTQIYITALGNLSNSSALRTMHR